MKEFLKALMSAVVVLGIFTVAVVFVSLAIDGKLSPVWKCEGTFNVDLRCHQEPAPIVVKIKQLVQE